MTADCGVRREGFRPALVAEVAECFALISEAFTHHRAALLRLPGGFSMSTLTIRLPYDKHERLKALANYDARVRFETRAARGNPKRAPALLDKLDLAD